MRTDIILEKLEEMYPQADTELEFNSNYQLLLAVMLSAQCTDKRVNIVTRELFKEYGTAEKMLELSQNELEKRGARENIDIITLSSMEECVEYANSIAKSNDIIVLSPASASFDMYKNFEVRGNHFKEIVNNLK